MQTSHKPLAPANACLKLERRRCEERSDEAIHSFLPWRDGLLRFARNDGGGLFHAASHPPRHCEERSDEAIHSFFARHNGLLRCARNDGVARARNDGAGDGWLRGACHRARMARPASRREAANACLQFLVIASAAKQSILSSRG